MLPGSALGRYSRTRLLGARPRQGTALSNPVDSSEDARGGLKIVHQFVKGFPSGRDVLRRGLEKSQRTP